MERQACGWCVVIRLVDLVADLWHDLPWLGRIAFLGILLLLVFDLLLLPAVVLLGGDL